MPIHFSTSQTTMKKKDFGEFKVYVAAILNEAKRLNSQKKYEGLDNILSFYNSKYPKDYRYIISFVVN